MNLEHIVNNTIKRLKQKFPSAVPEDLEDSVQSATLRYLELYGSCDNMTPAWLYLASYRRWLDLMRKNRRAVPSEQLEEYIIDDETTLVDIFNDTELEDVKAAARALLSSDDDSNLEGTS